MLKSLLTLAAMPQAFANTNAGSTLWIAVETADGSETPAELNDFQTLTEYEALFWTEIGGVGNVGETGSATNILTYDTWGDDVTQKSKGMTDAGSPTIEVAANSLDAGQIALLAAVDLTGKCAFKIVKNDAPVSGTPTIVYNRGLVTGPATPNGRNEDFDLEIYTLGLVQKQIKVPRSA